MPANNDIVKASQYRTVATAALIARVAAVINTCFIILAVIGEIWLRIGILLVVELGLLVSVLGLRPQHYSPYAPWVLLSAIWLAIINAVFTNGGGISNIALPWFAILVCVAGLAASSLRFSIIWALVAFASALGVLAAKTLGLQTPNLTPPQQRYALALLHVFAQLVCISALIIGYRKQLLRYQEQVNETVLLLEAEISQREHAESAALKANAQKDQFLRNVSHEFRTPLNSIIGFSERLLKKYSVQTELIAPLQAINRNGRSLHYFVSELLLLDAVVATPLEYLDARPAEILQELVTTNTFLAQSFGIKLTLTLDEASKAVCMPADVARLSQALCNILLFALRQSPSGEVKLSMATQAETIHISCHDCAPPLTSVQLSHLFETHYEMVLNNDKDIPSSAFSLKIAAVIIERHQGKLGALSTENGNTINVMLPRNN